MIAATFRGAHYSPPNYDFDTIAVFHSLEDAIEALFERYTANGQHTITTTYLDGHIEGTLWPTVGVGDLFTCYLMPEVDDHNDPEEVEGARLEVHTAVHGGWRDYTLMLADRDGDVIVEVWKEGI